MKQGYYRYGNVKIWGESTYEKYGVMKLLQSIDTESGLSAGAGTSIYPIMQGVIPIHIYCLSDSLLLGWAKHISEVRKRHSNKSKIIIFVPATVSRSSFEYAKNISVIPYARTLLRMRLLLKAALYTDKYDLIQKNEFKEHRGKYIFHQTLCSRDVSCIAQDLNMSPKTAYAYRENYSRKMLGFKNQQMARVFFIGCTDRFK
ncbi:hypothetical protein DCF83_11035 [Edwardsiella tarda]|uniref:hypothetical protein n=1 Tax=Edwardsiella tarda TaxID=636 RepID=UPI002852A99A|nr:hypothetical protein [Edwardsiella tarda]UCQ26597.1 hypothetical protein DCF83_11035 [Edwardsiella tarda]